MNRPAGAVRAFAVLLLAVLLVAGGMAVWNHGRSARWWGTSDNQQRLLDDPMAAGSLLGLTLLREDMSEAVGFAGMPKAPFVHHSFSPRDRPQQVLAELGAYAAAHGWRQEVALSDDTTWVGRKDVHGPNVASLIIHLEGIDGRHTTASEGEAVSVFLDYY